MHLRWGRRSIGLECMGGYDELDAPVEEEALAGRDLEGLSILSVK